MADVRIIKLKDNAGLLLRTGAWSQKIPADKLEEWIAFYERLAQKKDRLQSDASTDRREKMRVIAIGLVAKKKETGL